MNRLISNLFVLLALILLSGCGSKNAAVDGSMAANGFASGRLDVRLDQATEYELVEAFGKVVKTARGVLSATMYRQRIVPDEPAKCSVLWGVTVDDDTDGFILQANIVTMLNRVTDSGGTVELKGVPYRYSAAEIDLLKGVRPADATSRSLQFVLDRELARDRELAGRHDPY